jgi:cytochrome c oxidase subunit 3
MDLTQGTEKQKHERSRKMMLWFGIGSLIMAFAGWTSAYIISTYREDWSSEVRLPDLFFVSTAVLVISSITYILAKRQVKKENHKNATVWLVFTLILGILFVILQFLGFDEMIVKYGYRFTGPTSNIKMSFIYLIAATHILHVAAGLISLVVVLVQQLKGKYDPQNMLGIKLGATFWHFLDVLWIYLVLFMYFVK